MTKVFKIRINDSLVDELKTAARLRAVRESRDYSWADIVREELSAAVAREKAMQGSFVRG